MLVAYAFEVFFVLVLYISQFIALCTGGDKAYDKAANSCQCLAVRSHNCTGDAGECDCSAVMIHTNHCTRSAVQSRHRDMRENEHRNRSCAAFLRLLRSAFKRHYRALRETAPSFLDTAIFFALSVAVGMIATNLSQGFTEYEERILGYVSLLAALPLYTVAAFSSKDLRRKRLRQILTSLAVIPLCLGAGILMITYSDGRDRWGVVCFGYNLRFRAPRTVATYVIAVIVGSLDSSQFLVRLISWLLEWKNWPFTNSSEEIPFGQWIFLRLMHPCHMRIEDTALQKVFIWVVATCTLALTFFAGGCLAYDRRKMRGLAGTSYTESDMSYGQYLAALIWVPVAVEYFYHLICE